MVHVLALAAAAALSGAPPADGARTLPACAPRDAGAVTAAVQGMYDAARTGSDAFLGFWTPGARVFDGGDRLTPEAILDYARSVTQAGEVHVWRVTEPEVSFDCETALIAYVNKGSITRSGLTAPASWLEAAAMRYVDGRWRIAFFQSSHERPGGE